MRYPYIYLSSKAFGSTVFEDALFMLYVYRIRYCIGKMTIASKDRVSKCHRIYVRIASIKSHNNKKTAHRHVKDFFNINNWPYTVELLLAWEKELQAVCSVLNNSKNLGKFAFLT